LISEHNKKYLMAGIWVIVIGIILLVCGLIIGGGLGLIFDIGKWFDSSHTLTDNVAIALAWGGIILFIIGIFGILTAILKGSMEKPQEKVAPDSQ